MPRRDIDCTVRLEWAVFLLWCVAPFCSWLLLAGCYCCQYLHSVWILREQEGAVRIISRASLQVESEGMQQPPERREAAVSGRLVWEVGSGVDLFVEHGIKNSIFKWSETSSSIPVQHHIPFSHQITNSQCWYESDLTIPKATNTHAMKMAERQLSNEILLVWYRDRTILGLTG